MGKQLRIRLLKDTRYGKAGTVLTLPVEHGEALVLSQRAEIAPVAENRSMTHKSGIELRGGLERSEG